MTDERLRIRVTAPDHWRERTVELAPDTPVGQLKKDMLPLLLDDPEIDPDGYYVEYFEKEVLDESSTLGDLGVPDRGVVLLRPYDLDHPPPFKG